MAPGIEGTYHDPFHGGVARAVTRARAGSGHHFDIAGVYAGDETRGGRPEPGTAWTARVTVGPRPGPRGWPLYVDFSGKRGPGGGPHANYTATYIGPAGGHPAAIAWDDGPRNRWTREARFRDETRAE